MASQGTATRKRYNDLASFFGVLSIDILKERQRRGSEKVSSGELDQLLSKFAGNNSQATDLVKHSLERWQLRSRSLLNRDAAGNWKFAHRSIMEYSAAIGIFDKNIQIPTMLLTDQLKIFLWELFLQRSSEGKALTPPKLVPLHRIRDIPLTFTSMDSIIREHKQTLAATGSDPWPVSCDVDHRSFFHRELYRIARFGKSKSIPSSEFARVAAVIRTSKGLSHYRSQTEFFVPTIAITDFITGLRWHFYANLPEGEGIPFTEAVSSEYFRPPTVAEALSLEPVLSSRLDILAPALSISEDILTVSTSDKLDRNPEEQLVVKFRFENLRMVSRQILHTQGSSPLPNRGSIGAVLEKVPYLTSTTMADSSADYSNYSI